MTPRILVLAALVLVPAMLDASPLVPVVGSAGGGWQPLGTAVNPAAVTPLDAPTEVRENGFWAGYSYDRVKDTPPSSGSTACGAGALVLGYPCLFALGETAGLRQPVGPATPGQDVQYWGHPVGANVDPNFNADTSFYFSGLLELDLQILSEMTSWKDQVEIGWYVKDDPNATTPLIGGPGGIPKDSEGNYILGGPTSLTLNGQYGFYYKNYLNGTAFYTQSELNHLFAATGLLAYFNNFPGADDELMDFFVFDPKRYQQWALFGQGNRFWLGLEDIFGPTAQCEPGIPCSDYDFNDFLIGGHIERQDVPEPTTLTMLALGLFGAALALRRRRSES